MNRSPVLQEPRARSVTDDTEDSSSSETLLGNPRGPAGVESSRRRSIISLYLHLALVAIQVFLLVVWHQEWEHQIVFNVDHELRVAQLVKGILTTFITLYSALLVFVTQSLALRRDLHTRQLLTATHDNAVAWSGLGSAVVRLWEQRAIPASPTGVLTALTYLASVSTLHTAFPGVAAPQSLVVNQSVPISTQSLPAFDLSGVEENNRQDFLTAAGQYAEAALAFLPYLTPGNSLGLYEATLYDVLPPNAGTGSVRVNATGFNISCGYIPDTNFNATTQSITVNGTESWLGQTDTEVVTTVPLTSSNCFFRLDLWTCLSVNFDPVTFPWPALFYTSIPVLDSNNNTAPWINVTSPFEVDDTVVYIQLQVFRCSLGLVEQAVFVDSQSRNLTWFASERPFTEKDTSAWLPFSDKLGDLSTAAFADGARGFLDIWEAWYFAIPEAVTPPVLSRMSTIAGLSVADMALLQKLGLYPFNTTLRTAVYLHEVENELAKIVASMFWTLGHAPASVSSAQPFNVSLLTGQAIISVPMIQDRLDVSEPQIILIALKDGGPRQLNVISIIECLVASLVLLGLSSSFSRLERREVGATKTKIDGMDVLQTVWLYRNHPELAASLEQVQIPTDLNLRRAEMVRVQLIDGTAPMLKEFGEMSEDADVSLSETKYPPGKQGSKERLGSTWTSDLVLSLVSTILHLGLVLIHVILAVLGGMGLEHRITFSLSQQSLVSWLISTLATTFTTIYTAGLVFLTQTLSTKHSLRKTQMLTATHDTVAAWRGFGSALTSVFNQTPSLSSVVPAFMYLGGVLILHISSLGLLTVPAFEGHCGCMAIRVCVASASYYLDIRTTK
ncbi:hypothetical protein FB45DRAFT_1008690 [Roridomyces roridus]|uniref:Transmembrane protein n=1 Tax=Roridomyces roridus TaxID=1738132 RepID=A0AAD7FDW8_9AGAR|nr:hypothetical protein FB45DRAFT_1008690 [Roridomyces roridus]